MLSKNRNVLRVWIAIIGCMLMIGAYLNVFSPNMRRAPLPIGELQSEKTANTVNYSMGMGGSLLVGGQKTNFTMGKYGSAGYLTADGIPWLVLDVDEMNGIALVLSEYVMDFVQYNSNSNSPKYGFWSNSNIRAYLNGGQGFGSDNKAHDSTNSFYGQSFSKTEQSSITSSEIIAQKIIIVEQIIFWIPI